MKVLIVLKSTARESAETFRQSRKSNFGYKSASLMPSQQKEQVNLDTGMMDVAKINLWRI